MKKLKDLIRKQGGEWQPAEGKKHALSQFDGVRELTLKTAPSDYVSRVQSKAFRVNGYYQLDNLAKFNKWNNLLTTPKSRERWLFFGCPSDMLADILHVQELQPYGDWYAGLFGRNAIYLQDSADEAAHAAFRFNASRDGYLLSVRLAIQNAYHARQPQPKLTKPPAGHDVIRVPSGTDLGYGALPCELFATFDTSAALIRFITPIERV